MENSLTRRDEVVRETDEDHGGGGGNDNELDPLVLVHSDIAFVLHKIDELVVKATERKTISKVGATIIESFRSELSNMLSSLKPWFPRLQEAILVSSANEMETSITIRDEVVRETKEDHEGGGGNDNELGPLVLVHSDISSVLHKSVRPLSKQGTREVESFRSKLSNTISSLELWFPRLQFDKSTAPAVD